MQPPHETEIKYPIKIHWGDKWSIEMTFGVALILVGLIGAAITAVLGALL